MDSAKTEDNGQEEILVESVDTETCDISDTEDKEDNAGPSLLNTNEQQNIPNAEEEITYPNYAYDNATQPQTNNTTNDGDAPHTQVFDNAAGPDASVANNDTSYTAYFACENTNMPQTNGPYSGNDMTYATYFASGNTGVPAVNVPSSDGYMGYAYYGYENPDLPSYSIPNTGGNLACAYYASGNSSVLNASVPTNTEETPPPGQNVVYVQTPPLLGPTGDPAPLLLKQKSPNGILDQNVQNVVGFVKSNQIVYLQPSGTIAKTKNAAKRKRQRQVSEPTVNAETQVDVDQDKEEEKSVAEGEVCGNNEDKNESKSEEENQRQRIERKDDGEASCESNTENRISVLTNTTDEQPSASAASYVNVCSETPRRTNLGRRAARKNASGRRGVNRNNEDTVFNGIPLPEGQYPCAICKKLFSGKGTLRTHIVSHITDNPFGCVICNQWFSSKFLLQNHESENHMILLRYNCLQCKELVTTQELYTGHVCISVRECPFCDVKCSSADDFMDHLLGHLPVIDIRCRICDKSFLEKEQLMRHLQKHGDINYISCRNCKKRFLQKSDYDNHLVNLSGQKRFKCRICKKVFCSKLAYVQHILFHAGKKLYKCPRCPEKYLTTLSLNNHLTAHGDRLKYKCGQWTECFL